MLHYKSTMPKNAVAARTLNSELAGVAEKIVVALLSLGSEELACVVLPVALAAGLSVLTSVVGMALVLIVVSAADIELLSLVADALAVVVARG